jgi:hypothetical protein
MRKTLAAAIIAVAFAGCGMGPEWTTSQPGYPPQQAPPTAAVPNAYANPVFLPIADPQCAWETIVDTVDDYFHIEHEEPVRDAVTEGGLVTVPEVSPTVFEPWRRDTADYDQRVENTLQTMRRRAVVRVVPNPGGGYWVNVAVYKDLEDVVRPEHAMAGAATFRYDSTLTGVINPVTDQPITDGWIAQGRDTAMEQYMIADLMSRCGQAAAGTVR